MKISNFIKHPYSIICKIAALFSRSLSDKTYLTLMYYGCFGKKINWENPISFNEKLQWLKLYYKNPLYITLVDKLAVKEYISKKIGNQYVIPTIGVWDNVDDIDFQSLPSKFVLKTTHDGGGKGVVICKDKTKFDINKAKKILKNSLLSDSFLYSREWVYKDVPRKIIAEKYIENHLSHDLPDYKFFAFNGKVKAMFIATDRNSGNVKFDFFDSNFTHLDLVQTHPMSNRTFEKPECFDEMKLLASKLSIGIPEVRCDFYVVNSQVYFGEFTFFHHGGFVPFHPESWDLKFGKWIELPKRI